MLILTANNQIIKHDPVPPLNVPNMVRNAMVQTEGFYDAERSKIAGILWVRNGMGFYHLANVMMGPGYSLGDLVRLSKKVTLIWDGHK